MQIGARGAGAASTATGLLAPADTVAGTRWQIVDVLAVFEPDLPAGLEHRGADRRPIHLRGEQRAVLAAHRVAVAFPALRLAEIGQAIIPRPAAVAELPPVVVILGLAADVYEAIDRRGPADHPAAGVDDRAAVGAGVRLGPKLPRQGIVVEHLEEPGRDVDQRVPVAPARLDQQHPRAGVLGQPVGQHATRRAGTDDDVIRLHLPCSLRAHAPARCQIDCSRLEFSWVTGSRATGGASQARMREMSRRTLASSSFSSRRCFTRSPMLTMPFTSLSSITGK